VFYYLIMQLILGSEKCGYNYGGKIVEFLVKQINPNINVIVQDCHSSDVIISSHFFTIYPCDTLNKVKKNYIYFTGESYDPPFSQFHDKYIMISTFISDEPNRIYCPYFLLSPYLYLCRKYINNERPYLLAYCNSNPVKEREDLFNIFVEKTSFNECHSFGSCKGKYPATNIGKLIGTWESKEIIDKYKDYKFVIAMENKKKDGYVTEKILNAFYSGAIPIYWGSSNIKEFFNEKAFINVDDFESFEKCVEYVINLTNEQIQLMANEPIYNPDNDIVNLFNDDFNSQGNKTLCRYLEILKTILPSHI
jgi:hypothetical protein